MNYYKITITNISDQAQRWPRVGVSATEYAYDHDVDSVSQRVQQELTRCGLDLSHYQWQVQQVPDPNKDSQ
jgi:cbb3-type cytochrome oxidase cytochrome c subunit